MLLRGCFIAAKKVAIALDTLIRSPVPARRATRRRLRLLRAADPLRWPGQPVLARLRVRHEPAAWPGPGARHARAQPRRQSRDRGDHGRRTHRSLRERPGRVQLPAHTHERFWKRCARSVAVTRDGITINTFMLERSRALTEFVDRMTRINRGRAFYADARAARRVRAGRLREPAQPRRLALSAACWPVARRWPSRNQCHPRAARRMSAPRRIRSDCC